MHFIEDWDHFVNISDFPHNDSILKQLIPLESAIQELSNEWCSGSGFGVLKSWGQILC
jgi:hypothetical protein